MALFDMFKKKDCSVCGGEIGLLGNRKLEDGNLCKHCAKKLSPWFDDRRHSTVEQIVEQLAYREKNREQLAAFQTTRTLGRNVKVLLDENAGRFLISQEDDIMEENPDILSFSDITGCDLDIDETHRELKRADKDGKQVSYVPPRHEYRYDFYLTVHVNHPYFDDMRFRVNNSTVVVEYRENMPIGRSGFGQLLGSALTSFNPESNVEYRNYRQLAEEMRDVLVAVRQDVRAQAAAAAAPKTPVVCPHCGANTLPDARGCCEYCDSPIA